MWILFATFYWWYTLPEYFLYDWILDTRSHIGTFVLTFGYFPVLSSYLSLSTPSAVLDIIVFEYVFTYVIGLDYIMLSGGWAEWKWRTLETSLRRK